MKVNELLIEGYDRLPDLVEDAVQGLSADQLATPPAAAANTVGWLVWHLTRVQDHHVSELLGEEQIYLSGPFAESFGLPADAEDTGYGHTPGQVAAVRPRDADAALAYYRAVHDRTIKYLGGLSEADLDRVVDERWDPPVTLAVRLISILDDDTQHAGQAAYVRGLVL